VALRRLVQAGIEGERRPAGGGPLGVDAGEHRGADAGEVAEGRRLPGEGLALAPGQEEVVERRAADLADTDPQLLVVGIHQRVKGPRVLLLDPGHESRRLLPARGEGLVPAVRLVAGLAQAGLDLGDRRLVVERRLVVARLLGILLRHLVERRAQVEGGGPGRRPLVVDDREQLLADVVGRRRAGGGPGSRRRLRHLCQGDEEEEEGEERLDHGC
jgi:hypothetical protein